MPVSSDPLRLADSVFDRDRHICVFYHSDDEEFRVLLPFIKEGFEKGDKSFHIIEDEKYPTHLRRLQEAGIDTKEANGDRRVEVRGWRDAHLRPGWFDQQAMLGLVEEVLGEARRQGFAYTRWVANMGWALKEVRGTEDLVAYCARLNYLVPRYDATIV